MKEQNKRRMLAIEFGAFADSIEKQLTDQGLIADKDLIAKCDESASAITYIHILGFLSNSETRSARKRILNKIKKNVIVL